MTLEVGKKAPDFTLSATGSKTMTLSKLKGQPVVLYFYPKDDTPGCTAQACGFRDTMGELQNMGAAVLGLSKDSVASHEKFVKKYELNFPLLSDTDGKVCEAYGTWVEKSMYGKKYMGIDRATFLIDKDGKIAHVWRKVSVPGHIAAVAQAIHDLTKKGAVQAPVLPKNSLKSATKAPITPAVKTKKAKAQNQLA